MALVHPIFVPVYAAGGLGSMLKVVQGASSSILSNEFWNTNSPSQSQTPVRGVQVWGGNILFPMPNVSFTSQGIWEFNPRTGLFHICSFAPYLSMHIPVGKYLGLLDANYAMRGLSPKFGDLPPTPAPVSAVPNDFAILGNDVIMPCAGMAQTKTWAYPFTASLGNFSHTREIKRVCVHKGQIYGLNVATGPCYLHIYSGGSWVQIGSGFTPTESTKIQVYPGANAFFSAGGKLWVLFSYNNTGGASTYKHRLYELDTTLGTGTDRSATLLATTAWLAPASDLLRYAFEVYDDLGSTRKVYLFGYNCHTSSGWECYEFDGTNPLSLVHTGAHKLAMSAGAIYDELAHGCHVFSGADSVPSNYMTLRHRVSDLGGNGAVDVDLRYQNLSASPAAEPVFPACTEKAGVGSEGTVALASAPTPPGTIAGLSDNFDDSIFNEELWEKVYLAAQVGAVSRSDRSALYGGAYNCYNYLAEQGGSIRFGGLSPTPTILQYSGMGIKTRWGVNGAFQADIILSGLATMVNTAAMFFMAKTATNEYFGIYVYYDAGAPAGFKARGIYQQPNGTSVISAAYSGVIADGDTLRLARDGAGNITITAIISAVPNAQTPPTPPLYTGEVQFWFGCIAQTSANFANATPGPGASSFTVSGAGTVGKWEGDKEHVFCWDHIADLGAGINAGIVIHADTAP